jgi:RimJ/RimL family protein N-acetyltransferase
VAEGGFVPDDFVVPDPPADDTFVLEPLGPQHNESDYAAWTSSMAFIRSLPGWADETWPTPMTLADNLRDLEQHAAGFARRAEFTYTVLEPGTREVIGCVYVQPTREAGAGATEVHSWVRADRADLDQPLRDLVRGWLATAWPFTEVQYAGA